MSLTLQFNTMVAMIVMGGWLGVALDTYGRFVKRPKRTSFVLFIYDILFWFVQALLFFYVLLLVNEGQLRFYIILAILCGYAAYQSLLRNLYVKLLEVMIKAAILTYHFFYRLTLVLLVRPIKGLIQLLLVTVLFIINAVLKILKIILFIVLSPIKWIFRLIWGLLPKKFKMFLLFIEGFFIRKKNSLVIWWKNFRK